ncbi:Tricarboxylate transport protein TctC [Desulfosporosinus sp. I2]|uniref:tripartite tricarboxylate transporter substrate binding protein n=1 Tax=Desulfosporosinus sp. I2 TaxID=1617025 RepID=UPI0005EEE2CB|nr:tripartite tricarboxylate transporter substrate binding protein [Desulfosporosinus sp. I2]KJR48965.1 Tricarboxylate transport protein TctC [Desulfosporosinus sp. I2]
MKKIMALIVSAALLGITLVGCGTQTAQQTPAQPKANVADSYPSKPIQVIVPAGPGGDTDTYARLVGQSIEKSLGKGFVVVNVNGAGGSLGTKKVIDSAPDGLTALFFHPSLLVNKTTKVTDYGIEAFELGGIVVNDDTNAFVVRADSPYKTLKDLIDAAKASPGKLIIGTEMGGFTNLQCLTFNAKTGTNLNIVDVGSSAQKNAALEGKQVDVIPQPVGQVKSFVDAGKFRVLGIMADKRSEIFPDIPTFKEQGVDIVLTKPYYFAFPKGTPKEIVDKFNAAVEKVTKDPDFAKGLEKWSVKPIYMAPDKALTYLQAEQKTLDDAYASVKK